jgi:hypothetical protein
LHQISAAPTGSDIFKSLILRACVDATSPFSQWHLNRKGIEVDAVFCTFTEEELSVGRIAGARERQIEMLL